MIVLDMLSVIPGGFVVQYDVVLAVLIIAIILIPALLAMRTPKDIKEEPMRCGKVSVDSHISGVGFWACHFSKDHKGPCSKSSLDKELE